MRVYLIGFMGCGKTTLGRELASKLQYRLIDLDHYIEEKENMKVKEIFAVKGENHFRLLEKQAIVEMAELDNIVVATGGGLPCFFDNISSLNGSGHSIYLKVSVTELCRRLKRNKEDRPLVKDKTDEELSGFIEGKLKEREPFYSQAKSIIESDCIIVNDLLLTLQQKI